MSYFDYLACSRELPTGLFGQPPKAIYNSYMDYKNSSDFVVPRNPFTNEPEDMNSESQKELEQIKGNVVVYETFSDFHSMSLEPYEPIVTRRGSDIFETSMDVMAKHFTLPYLYNLDMGSEKMLSDYLCKYLQPGDQAEVYTCWAGEEEETFKGQIQIVDLQEVVQGRNLSDLLQPTQGNAFTRYLAPSTPQLQNIIAPVKPVDHIMEVVKEDGDVCIILQKAREQGFFS